MTGFPRPTLAALRDQAMSNFAARLTGADMSLRRSNLVVAAIVLAGLVNGEYGYIDWIVENVFLPDTATGDYLVRWAAVKGLAREPATPAAGSVIFTGTSGMLIPSGTVLQTSDLSLQFATTAAALMGGGGSVTVAIEALSPSSGSAGNLATAAPLSLVTALAGVSGTATVAAPGLSGGTDEESDDGLRNRLLLALRQPPQGGTVSDYEQWALDVAGVTRAWAYPLHRGAGTVDLTFVMDGRTNIIPLTADVTAVQDFIGVLGGIIGVKPVTDDCLVFAPTPSAVNITITGLPTAAQAGVLAALTDLFATAMIPGGGLSFQDQLIPAVASGAAGASFAVTSPSADVAGSYGVLLQLGTVTW